MAQNEFYVYMLLDPRKNDIPFYVGKGKGPRAYQHGKEVKIYNQLKENVISAIRNAGKDFQVTIVEESLNETEAFDLEMNLIKKYGRRDIDKNGILTNRTLGGQGCSGRKHTEETKRKISEGNKGKTMSEEANKKISESKMGKKNPHYGATTTSEAHKVAMKKWWAERKAKENN